MTYEKLEYRVYVIAFHDEVLKRPDFRKRNPLHRPGKPCLCVGQTAKDPRVRLKEHLAGSERSSKKVKRYGKYLRWLLFRKYQSVDTREEAVKLEQEVAEYLQSKGYAVWWNQADHRLTSRCSRPASPAADRRGAIRLKKAG